MKLGITGASGQMGTALVRHALTRTAPSNLVAITRNVDKLAEVKAQGVEVRSGDFSNAAGLAAAFHGIDRLVMIPTGDLVPGVRIGQHKTAIEAAAKAGVKHVIYVSSVSPRPGSNVLLDSHFATEQALIGSGMSWTFLRMSVYMDSLVNAAKQAAASGTYSAVPGAAAAYITRDDIAAAAAGLLTSDGHQGITYHATGTESLIQAEVAEAIAKASGKRVAFAEMTAHQQQEGLVGMGLPPFLVDGIMGFHSAIRAGAFDLVTHDVERLTGTPAETLEAFLRRSL